MFDFNASDFIETEMIFFKLKLSVCYFLCFIIPIAIINKFTFSIPSKGYLDLNHPCAIMGYDEELLEEMEYDLPIRLVWLIGVILICVF